MNEIISFLKDTFEKFAIDDLQKYLECNNYPSRFYLFSDYCLHNKNKTHDVVTYTIMPYSPNINTEKAIISSIASQDIKHVKIVNHNFINYLKKQIYFILVFFLVVEILLLKEIGLLQENT